MLQAPQEKLYTLQVHPQVPFVTHSHPSNTAPPPSVPSLHHMHDTSTSSSYIIWVASTKKKSKFDDYSNELLFDCYHFKQWKHIHTSFLTRYFIIVDNLIVVSRNFLPQSLSREHAKRGHICWQFSIYTMYKTVFIDNVLHVKRKPTMTQIQYK